MKVGNLLTVFACLVWVDRCEVTKFNKCSAQCTSSLSKQSQGSRITHVHCSLYCLGYGFRHNAALRSLIAEQAHSPFAHVQKVDTFVLDVPSWEGAVWHIHESHERKSNMGHTSIKKPSLNCACMHRGNMAPAQSSDSHVKLTHSC